MKKKIKKTVKKVLYVLWYANTMSKFGGWPTLNIKVNAFKTQKAAKIALAEYNAKWWGERGKMSIRRMTPRQYKLTTNSACE